MRTTAVDPLTARQREMYEFLLERQRLNGMPPSFREIGERFGFTTNGVMSHLRPLVKKGFVVRPAGKGASRGYVAVESERATHQGQGSRLSTLIRELLEQARHVDGGSWFLATVDFDELNAAAAEMGLPS